jgi:hypothetical protein
MKNIIICKMAKAYGQKAKKISINEEKSFVGLILYLRKDVGKKEICATLLLTI